MWYGYPRYRRRGPRFPFGIPFIFPFLIFIFSRSIGAFIITMLIVGVIFFIMRAMASANSNSSSWWSANSQWQQPTQQQYYQPPVQQPQQQYYQPTQQQQPYRPYGEGYNAEQAGGEQSAAQGASQYDDYEQPQAQYPEQLPPMQQR